MKRNIQHTLWTVALLLLTACDHEDLITPDSGYALSITVTDGGYHTGSDDDAAGQAKPLSRTSENDMATTFTEGDACGLYMVRGGSIVYDNIKLSLRPGGGWEPDEEGVELLGGKPHEYYFLYYPYRSDSYMSGKVNASATDAEGFFTPLVKGWSPRDDQSSKENYTASDLMTAQGTVSTGENGSLSLTFNMAHRMALAIITLPENVEYRSEDNENTYKVPIAGYSINKVYQYSGRIYRYIVRPNTYPGISGSFQYAYGTKEQRFSFSPNASAGQYRHYRVSGIINSKLRVGDYVLADGSILPGERELSDELKEHLVGIVFYVGQHENDNTDYTDTNIKSSKCHGYAISATSLGQVYGWGPQEKEGFYTSDSKIDWNGYTWTQTIFRKTAGQSGHKYNVFAAVQNAKAQPPVNSTGWYLPSLGYCREIYRAAYSSSGEGGEIMREMCQTYYWTSTENPANPYYNVYLNSPNDSFYTSNKYNTYVVWPVFAF